MRPTLGTDLESVDEASLQITNLAYESSFESIPDIGAVDTWFPSFPEKRCFYLESFEQSRKSSPLENWKA